MRETVSLGALREGKSPGAEGQGASAPGSSPCLAKPRQAAARHPVVGVSLGPAFAGFYTMLPPLSIGRWEGRPPA